MHSVTSRVIQWREREALIDEIPIEGVLEGHPRQCAEAHALVYAGHGRTDQGGSWTVSLPAISCIRPGPAGNRRPSVTATPTTEISADPLTDDPEANVVPQPYILVTRTRGSLVSVWSFFPNGERASFVEFSWHCVVEEDLVGLDVPIA